MKKGERLMAKGKYKKAKGGRFLLNTGCYTFPKNSKYFSLLIPIMRILFLTTNAGTFLYFGMTTGRIASG